MSTWKIESTQYADNCRIVDEGGNVIYDSVQKMESNLPIAQTVAEHNALVGIPDPKAAIEAAREALESDHTSDCATHEDAMLPCSCPHGKLVKKALSLLNGLGCKKATISEGGN